MANIAIKYPELNRDKSNLIGQYLTPAEKLVLI